MFHKCYEFFESLIQLLPAMVYKHFLSFFFSRTAHVNTPTHLSLTNTDFLCHSEPSTHPFQASSQKITKVTFSKVCFLTMQGKVLEVWSGRCCVYGRTLQNVILDPLSQNYASRNSILETHPSPHKIHQSLLLQSHAMDFNVQSIS